MPDPEHLDPWDSLNETILETIVNALGEIDDPLKQQQAIESLGEALPRAYEDAADSIVAELVDAAPGMLSHYNELDSAYVSGIRDDWGSALDRFRMAWVSSYELGEAFSNRHFNVDGYEPGALLDALLGLHARACRVATEVFVLMVNGLGAGALARARTLHEIAVISTLLGGAGSPSGSRPDLAQRYLAHAAVVTWMDADEYQLATPSNGQVPFSDDELAAMKSDRDRVVAAYGPQFARPNGWAACLMSDGNAPRFKDMEALAKAEHLRPHYSWASHEVHADAKSWVQNHQTLGGVSVRVTGPSPFGLSDPGQLALIALNRITVDLLTSDPDFGARPADVIAIAVLGRLVSTACDAFAAAEEQAAMHASSSNDPDLAT